MIQHPLAAAVSGRSIARPLALLSLVFGLYAAVAVAVLWIAGDASAAEHWKLWVALLYEAAWRIGVGLGFLSLLVEGVAARPLRSYAVLGIVCGLLSVLLYAVMNAIQVSPALPF